MADQNGQSQDVGYERLGEAKLSLVDVVAQSVGFMGPVFSAAFIIPLIIGVNFAARGAGTSAALAVLLAGVGVFALGWIVAQYAKRIHAAGSLYDYVSEGLGSTIGAAAGWLYYGGTIILTTGLGVLLGGFVHDNLLPTLEINLDLPIWLWDVLFGLLLFVVLYFGVQISTRVQLLLALISIAVVLIFFVTVIIDLGSANDVGKAFDPSPEGGFSGILFGVLYGVLIFVGFETAANLAEETAEPKRVDPASGAGRRGARLDLLPDRGLRGGRRLRIRPRGHHESGGGGCPIVRAGRARHGVRVGVLAQGPDDRRLPRHARGLHRGRRGVDPRGVRDGSRPPASRSPGVGLVALRDPGRCDRLPGRRAGPADRGERMGPRSSRCPSCPTTSRCSRGVRRSAGSRCSWCTC